MCTIFPVIKITEKKARGIINGNNNIKSFIKGLCSKKGKDIQLLE